MKEAKILIVEDNPEKRDRYIKAAEAAGHVVLGQATTGQEAYNALNHFSDDPEQTPDVVLLDGILDEAEAKRIAEREGAVPIEGNTLAGLIRERRSPEFRAKVEQSQSVREMTPAEEAMAITRKIQGEGGGPLQRIEPGKIIPENVRTIGISSMFALDNADVPRATPEEAVAYIDSLPQAPHSRA